MLKCHKLQVSCILSFNTPSSSCVFACCMITCGIQIQSFPIYTSFLTIHFPFKSSFFFFKNGCPISIYHLIISGLELFILSFLKTGDLPHVTPCIMSSFSWTSLSLYTFGSLYVQKPVLVFKIIPLSTHPLKCHYLNVLVKQLQQMTVNIRKMSSLLIAIVSGAVNAVRLTSARKKRKNNREEMKNSRKPERKKKDQSESRGRRRSKYIWRGKHNWIGKPRCREVCVMSLDVVQQCFGVMLFATVVSLESGVFV